MTKDAKFNDLAERIEAATVWDSECGLTCEDADYVRHIQRRAPSLRGARTRGLVCGGCSIIGLIVVASSIPALGFFIIALSAVLMLMEVAS